MTTRMNQLEHSILELGTELYKVKHQLSSVSEVQEQFIKTIKGLRSILDEKGVITSDDFDAAVELGDAINFDAHGNFESSGENQLNWAKKDTN